MSNRVSVYVPGSIGNVGPGFDVLGLAVGGIGNVVTIEEWEGGPTVGEISGLDEELIPRTAEENCSVVAARHYFESKGREPRFRISIDNGLPVAGGLGCSAASSVGGAVAAAILLGKPDDGGGVLEAALEGEARVSGRHLDNVAPSFLGGLVLVLSVDPIDVIQLPVSEAWSLAFVTPRTRIRTKDARDILPKSWDRDSWTRQMASTVAVSRAFVVGDAELLRRALVDRCIEPHRAPLIPRFDEMKQAAIDAGAFGCSISGSGPTVFAIAPNDEIAGECRNAMQVALLEEPAFSHVGSISMEGAVQR